MRPTTTAAFFEAKYQASSDPWNFATSTYEQGRFEAIIRSLTELRYRLAFEPGCSVGVLTEKLAQHCDRVEAYDISPTAVERTRERCSRVENVSVSHASVRDRCPSEADLYLLCEVGYYLSREELAQLLAWHVDCLAPGATVVGCHWLGVSADHLLSGDVVHEVIHNVPTLSHQYGERRKSFRLDRWVKRKNEYANLHR